MSSSVHLKKKSHKHSSFIHHMVNGSSSRIAWRARTNEVWMWCFNDGD